jgi:hypothetical protein
LVGLPLKLDQVAVRRAGGDGECALPTMLGSPAFASARRLFGSLTILAVTDTLRHAPSVKYELAEDASSVGSEPR